MRSTIGRTGNGDRYEDRWKANWTMVVEERASMAKASVGSDPDCLDDERETGSIELQAKFQTIGRTASGDPYEDR